MYNLKNIKGPITDPYEYLAEPIFNMPGITTNHELKLVAFGLFTEELYSSKTQITPKFIESCVENPEEVISFIVEQKVKEFKKYVAKEGSYDNYKVSIYLNDDLINVIEFNNAEI